WFTEESAFTNLQKSLTEDHQEHERHRELVEDAARVAEAMRLAAESLGTPVIAAPGQTETPLPLITAQEPSPQPPAEVSARAGAPSTDLLPDTSREKTDRTRNPLLDQPNPTPDWHSKTEPGTPPTPSYSSRFAYADTDRIKVPVLPEEPPAT